MRAARALDSHIFLDGLGLANLTSLSITKNKSRNHKDMSFAQSILDGLYNQSRNPRESWRSLHRNLKSVSPRPILKLSKNTHACVCHNTRDGIYNQPMNPCALTRIRASYTSAMYNCVTRAEVLRSLLRKH